MCNANVQQFSLATGKNLIALPRADALWKRLRGCVGKRIGVEIAPLSEVSLVETSVCRF